MTGVTLLVARGVVRHHRRSLLGLTLLVALVGTVVLASAAGARRTATLLDRAQEATAARDLRVQVDADDKIPRVTDALEASPDVEAVVATTIFPVGNDSEYDFPLFGDPEGHLAVDIDRPVAIDGRLPDPNAGDEVAVNPRVADLLDLEVGSTMPVTAMTPDDRQALFEGRFDGYHGPELDLRVVGVFRPLDGLQGGAIAGPYGLVGPGFFSTHGDEVAGFPPVLTVRLEDRPGAADRVTALATEAAGGADVSTETAADFYADSLDRALHALTVGLVVFTLIAVAVGLVAAGQAVSRQVGAVTGVDEGLRALGLRRVDRAVAIAAAPVVAVVVGTVLAIAGSVAASPLFPFGLARDAEPDPGVRLDRLVTVVGAIALLVLLLALAAWRALRPPRGEVERERPPVADRVTRGLKLPATPSLALRMAFDPGRGRNTVPIRSAVTGAVIGVVGVIGVGVVVASLSALVDDPGRWGWNWSTAADITGPDMGRDQLAGVDGLDAAAVLDKTLVRMGDEEVSGYAIDPITGDTSFTLLTGRLPADDGEVALGRGTADALDVSVGGEVTAQGADGGEDVPLEVVGEVVIPLIDTPVPGEGALLTPAGLDAVRASDGFESLLLTYADGVDEAALEDRLTERLGLTFADYGRPTTPGDVANLDEVRSLTVGLGAFFVLVALLGVGHALTLSTRRRQGDFAVLRSMGFRRRQVHRSVALQAMTVVAVGLVIGIPVGLVAGRVSWRLMVESVGVVDDPSQPWRLLVAVVPLTLAAAAAIAAVPAWRAARRRPAQVLRSE